MMVEPLANPPRQRDRSAAANITLPRERAHAGGQSDAKLTMLTRIDRFRTLTSARLGVRPRDPFLQPGGGFVDEQHDVDEVLGAGGPAGG
jgi:hypothetical protein